MQREPGTRWGCLTRMMTEARLHRCASPCINASTSLAAAVCGLHVGIRPTRLLVLLLGPAAAAAAAAAELCDTASPANTKGQEMMAAVALAGIGRWRVDFMCEL